MGRRLALLVGTTRYEDALLTALQAPEADLRGLADVLRAPDICGFDDVNLLLNATASRVSLAVCEFFSGGKPDDLLVLYFSGHGVVDPGGGLYLCTSDSRKALLRATALPASLVRDEMDNCRARSQILILDCCHAGAFARDAKSAGVGVNVNTKAAFEGNGIGRVVLTASDATQVALQGDSVVGTPNPSVFTRYLIEALQTGVADANGDGVVTIDEVYEYVYRKVLEENPNQTPGKWTYKQHGTFVFAKNPKPKARPDLLDRRLVEVLQSDAPHALREAAAVGLVHCLNDPRPGVVLAAREFLTQFISDDSRAISSITRAALEVGTEDINRESSPSLGSKPPPASLRSQCPEGIRESSPPLGSKPPPASLRSQNPEGIRESSSPLGSKPPVSTSVLPEGVGVGSRRPRASRIIALAATVIALGAVATATAMRKRTSWQAGQSLQLPGLSVDASVSTNTGSIVLTASDGGAIEVSLDGQRIGVLPQTIEHVSPSTHSLLFDGGPKFEPAHREIVVKPGVTLQLEPIRLNARQRTLVISLGDQMERAKVFIIRDGNKQLVQQFPATLSVAEDAQCIVEAYWNGKRLTQPVVWRAEQREQRLSISTQSPWRNGASPDSSVSPVVAHDAAPAALPGLRVRVGAAHCEAAGEQVQASMGRVKAQLQRCISAQSSSGEERYELKVSSAGQVTQRNPQGSNLDRATHGCVLGIVNALGAIHELSGCTVQLVVIVGS
jgi:hypothetical protein